jgi:hypothetical protein
MVERVMVRARLVVSVRTPDVPVMVMVELPTAVDEPAVSVN